MSVRNRLDRLRRQGGAAAPSPLPLAERLARLGPARRETGVRDSARPGDAELAGRCGGECIAPGVIRLVETVAPAALHGRLALSETIRWRPADEGPAAGYGGAPLTLVDTETTGLAGGTGTLVFLLGLLRIEAGTLRLTQLLLTGFHGERAFVEAAEGELKGTAGLVSYNGKAFDIPLLSARCRLTRRPDPWSGLPHLDLLHPVRRLFADRWPDCRLATAERRLLGFERVGDLPGSEAPAAWFDWVRRGDWRRLPDVARHNRWDLLSLAGLLPVLERAWRAPGEWGGSPLAVARAHLAGGRESAALALLGQARATLDAEGLLLLARIHRRRGQWREALAIWQPLAEAGHPEAVERLAKYHEHVARDFTAALRWTRRLLELQGGTPEHRRRAERLCGRLAGAAATVPVP